MVDRILDALQLLELFPESGRPGRVEGTRELVVPRLPYIVVYQVDRELEAVRVQSVIARRTRPLGSDSPVRHVT